jgi:hypothetical protein
MPQCERCHKDFKSQYQLNRHLNRKNPCNKIEVNTLLIQYEEKLLPEERYILDDSSMFEKFLKLNLSENFMLESRYKKFIIENYCHGYTMETLDIRLEVSMELFYNEEYKILHLTTFEHCDSYEKLVKYLFIKYFDELDKQTLFYCNKFNKFFGIYSNINNYLYVKEVDFGTELYPIIKKYILKCIDFLYDHIPKIKKLNDEDQILYKNLLKYKRYTSIDKNVILFLILADIFVLKNYP